MSGYKNTWIRKSRTTVGLRLNFPWWFVPNLREQWILCPAVWGRNVGQIIYYHYREFRFLLVSKECSAAAHSDTSDNTSLLPSVTAGLEMSKPAPLPSPTHPSWCYLLELQTNLRENYAKFYTQMLKVVPCLSRKIKTRKLRRWKTIDTFILFCCYWKQMLLKHTQFQAPGLIWELKSSNLYWWS